ncbi:MAG: glutathione S-transferase family protein [Vitreoscilla sp.]|nr:glutathione S-transferase family protein [Vitreoscilla sp.]MBP6674867.1 glutathione S-transferase family protein [Vitreoscilla sp.]
MITLYEYALSGNCYKVRQLAAWLGLPLQRVPINLHPGQQHKSAEFLALNPLGQVPVINDDGFVLRDSQAILVYLASRHDSEGRWYPADPQARGQITLWLAVAEDLNRTASAARTHDTLGDTHIDVVAARAGAHAVFRTLDDHLAERASAGAQWLVGDAPTIADIACFPYVALAQDGGLSLDAYPALRHWVWAFRHLPGFIGMGGIRVPDPTQRPLQPGTSRE